MEINEKGVLKESEIFFHNASETAKRVFFYLLCCGNYSCDNHYHVKRSTYHSFLFIYVIKGNGFIVKNGKEVFVKTNSLMLLDCTKEHEYGTNQGWKIYWVHCNGLLCKEWYALINNKNNGIIPLDNFAHCYQTMKRLIDNQKYNKGSNEAFTNQLIVNLFSELMVDPIQKENEKPLSHIAGYITNNLNKKISLDELAEIACMSKFNFIRVFHKEFGYTPHEFIIYTRINAAKFYLLTTKKSVKEIVYLCGFNNESAFSNTFKKVTGITPGQYKRSEHKEMLEQ